MLPYSNLISVAYKFINLYILQTSQDNILQSSIFIVVLLYSIFDIFIVLYLANEITDASNQLSYCLFESNWMEQSEKCKKCVIILGEVLKRPQQLIIFIYPMNLDTFTKVSLLYFCIFPLIFYFFISITDC